MSFGKRRRITFLFLPMSGPRSPVTGSDLLCEHKGERRSSPEVPIESAAKPPNSLRKSVTNHGKSSQPPEHFRLNAVGCVTNWILGKVTISLCRCCLGMAQQLPNKWQTHTKSGAKARVASRISRRMRAVGVSGIILLPFGCNITRSCAPVNFYSRSGAFAGSLGACSTFPGSLPAA